MPVPEIRLPLADAAFIRDPYPFLADCRERTPAFHDPGMNRLVLTRHADISALLRDSRRFGRSALHRYSRDELGWPPPDGRQANFDSFNDNHLLESEPPKHTRLRGLLQLAFTPRRVEALRPRIQAILQERLSNLGQAFDLVSEYAEPLPVTVIAELLGVPQAWRDSLRPWSAAIVKLYEPDKTAQDQADAEKAVLDFSAHLRELVAQRRKEPGEDLISALVQVEMEGDRLTEKELIDTCILLLNAGHEASVNGLSAGVLALLRQRSKWAELGSQAGDPASHPAFVRAVDELLRFDTPLPMFERICLEPCELFGHELKPGDRVSLLYASGNRDPRRFDDPDSIHLSRDPNPHLTFGLGIHYCLGAPLARLELALSLQALCAQFPNLHLVSDTPEYTGGFVIRGLARLPVTTG